MAVVWMAIMMWVAEAEGWCWWDLWTPWPLPQAIFKKLKPIYMCLASKDLFQRCLRCATQNAESFYGLVWSYCPRESLCGADTVACLQPCCTAIQSLHVPRPYRMYSWRRWVAQLASTTWMHWPVTRGQDAYSQVWEEETQEPEKKQRKGRTSCRWGRYNLESWGLLNNFL